VRKADFAVLRDVGRVIVTGTLAHGLTTRSWREWHSVGFALWAIGEIGYAVT
jgi:hypothetical protein